MGSCTRKSFGFFSLFRLTTSSRSHITSLVVMRLVLLEAESLVPFSFYAFYPFSIVMLLKVKTLGKKSHSWF